MVSQKMGAQLTNGIEWVEVVIGGSSAGVQSAITI
jgi:hypothetical protein